MIKQTSKIIIIFQKAYTAGNKTLFCHAQRVFATRLGKKRRPEGRLEKLLDLALV